MKECKHTEGWVLREPIVLSDSVDEDNDFEEILECNVIGCGATKHFKFGIMYLEEIKAK
jgi:hypothetical protein